MEWPDNIQAGETEQLEPMVRRVLAPNPSPYTFTGTQTWLVGDRSDLAVIDPGPADAAHLDAIVRAAGDQRIAVIACTHTHRDHSPGAAPLSERTGAPVVGCAPLVISDDGPRADESFDTGYAPDRVLTDGERLSGDGWTLEAVATPGHTSNHLCFALLETGALFTGDHVMGWSTSVISPPDGDMTDYMKSLQKLQEREDRVYYPAHGPAVPNPRQFVRGMMGHRKQRERQILRLLENGPARIAEDMVPAMYKAIDSRLYGAAGRSVLAHLIDLERRGVVRKNEPHWELVA